MERYNIIWMGKLPCQAGASIGHVPEREAHVVREVDVESVLRDLQVRTTCGDRAEDDQLYTIISSMQGR